MRTRFYPGSASDAFFTVGKDGEISVFLRFRFLFFQGLFVALFYLLLFISYDLVRRDDEFQIFADPRVIVEVENRDRRNFYCRAAGYLFERQESLVIAEQRFGQLLGVGRAAAADQGMGEGFPENVESRAQPVDLHVDGPSVGDDPEIKQLRGNVLGFRFGVIPDEVDASDVQFVLAHSFDCKKFVTDGRSFQKEDVNRTRLIFPVGRLKP